MPLFKGRALSLIAAWSLVLGDGPANEEALGDLRHLQHLLEEYPEAEGAMQLQVLSQLRAALNLVDNNCAD